MSTIVIFCILYLNTLFSMFYCIYVCFPTLSTLNEVNIVFYYLKLSNYINLFSNSKIKHKRGFGPFDYISQGF